MTTKQTTGYRQPRAAALERRRARCTGGWKQYGRDSEQLALPVAPCTCRTLATCIDCERVHVFVALCESCANAGKRGVPWAEIPGRTRTEDE